MLAGAAPHPICRFSPLSHLNFSHQQRWTLHHFSPFFPSSPSGLCDPSSWVTAKDGAPGVVVSTSPSAPTRPQLATALSWRIHIYLTRHVCAYRRWMAIIAAISAFNQWWALGRVV